MTIESFVFFLLAGIAIIAAILVVTVQNIARALFLFFVVLFSVAGLYIFALADFVAITQIMVYVGGVLVLMLFAFMLSNKKLLNEIKTGSQNLFSLPIWQSAFIALAFLAITGYVVFLFTVQEPSWITAAKDSKTMIQANENTIEQLGFHLMTRYILPFEVASIFIMIALIGSAHIARKENTP